MFDDRIGNLQKMLARMDAEGRQKYATDHADDPIAVSMALFVNNIAKEIKEGKRGEPEVQTPVVQQAIQAMNQPRMQQAMPPQAPQQAPQAPQAMPQQQAPQMAANGGYMDSRLPEEMGIGALPERSLSNMADGGIVGFADRGLVPDLPGGAIERARRAILEKRAAEERLTPRRGYMTPPAIYDQDTQNAYQQPQETPANVAQQTALPPALPSAAPAAPPPAAAAPRPAAPPAVRPTAGAPTGAPPAAATGIQTLLTSPDLTPEAIAEARANFTKAQPAVVDTLKAERQALVDEKNKNAAAEYTSFKERMAKQGDPYAKQEERANKQEASVAESAERNPYLALMEAGFAMMAGDSPYAMVNLGKGALAGTKTYRDGLALIEKAKEKLTETRDRIDGLRLIRSDLNASEERDIQREIRRTALEGKTIIFNAFEKLTGESKAQIESNVKMFMEAETARRLADRQYNTEVMKQGEETKRAEFNARTQTGIAAANRAMQKTIAEMLPGETRATMMLGTGKTDQERLESGLQKAQEISGNPKLIIEAYTKYSKEMIDALKTPMSAEAFAAQTLALLEAVKKKGRLLSPQEEALVNKFAPKQ